MPCSGPLFFFSDGGKESVGRSRKIMLRVLVSWCYFSSWCQFLGKACKKKNRAIMSILGYFCLFWTLNLVLMFVGKVGWCQFSRLLQLCCGEGSCPVMARIMNWSSYEMLLIDPPQRSYVML